MTLAHFPTVVLASRNAKKSREIRDLLAPVGIPLKSVAEFPEAHEVEETGTTFAENAALKATEIAKVLKHWTIGEDSGLRVDALRGAPGVYSARYSDPGATDERNNAKLIAELATISDDKRGAGYICSVALSNPQGKIRIACEGTCRGRILREANGEGGFGYDPYFLIPEYHLTFGQLSSVVKHRLSHRARAFAKFIPLLQNICHEF